MNPRLIGMAGPLEGTTVGLSQSEVSIGRERSNQLWVNDLSVSRRHCVIRRENGQFKVNDLGSYNGTRVNGVPVMERVLEHGDLLALGDSILLFLIHEETEAPAAASSVELDESKPGSENMLMIRIEDAVFMRPEKVSASTTPGDRVARDLGSLVRLAALINQIRGAEDIQARLLEAVFELVPAQRAALLLNAKGSDEFVSMVGRDRLSPIETPVPVSRTIVNQALRDGIAVLVRGGFESGALTEAGVPLQNPGRSVLCVPLTAHEETLGALYLHTNDPAVPFDEHHLQVTAALANLAAVALRKAGHLQWLEGEKKRLETEIELESRLIGESSAMREVFQVISRVAPADTAVLVCGESGTGKELIARSIHSNSPRAEKTFLTVNCAGISENLLERELFGYEKGSFTGALAQNKSRLEAADGGTVFLDEIGELPVNLQMKLFHLLQDRQFKRVGGEHPIAVDVRIIASTNKDLEEQTRNGSFRAELYFRLSGVRITIPPLRQRREDVPLLAAYFLSKYSARCKRQVRGISADARECLVSYDWPGNVRELQNVIERAVIRGSSEMLLPDDLPDQILETLATAGASVPKYHEGVRDAKKRVILRALEEANGNYIAAAALLGLHPNNLYRLISDLELKGVVTK